MELTCAVGPALANEIETVKNELPVSFRLSFNLCKIYGKCCLPLLMSIDGHCTMPPSRWISFLRLWKTLKISPKHFRPSRGSPTLKHMHEASKTDLKIKSENVAK